MTLFYTDVANVNWDDSGTGIVTPAGQQNLISFLSQLQGEGFAGVAHKMTQGATFVDDYGAVAQTWCAQNNFPFIGYHYLSTEDAGAQAQNWKNAGGGSNAMMDHENGGGDINNFWAVVNAFNSIGVNVQIEYLPHWYWQDNIGSPDLSGLAANQILLVSSGYPGGTGYASDIYAASGGDSGEGFAPYGGATPSAWQFTDKATVAGFTVDVNAYPGTDIGVLFGTSSAPVVAPPVIVTPPSIPPVSTTGSVTPVSTPTPPVAATPPPADPTDLDQVLTYLIQELSASGDTALTASTNTVPAPNLTLRTAVQAILWITNAAVDMKGTDSAANARPFPPTTADTILGHILSMRAEGLITQAIVADLASALGRDVPTLIKNAKASWS